MRRLASPLAGSVSIAILLAIGLGRAMDLVEFGLVPALLVLPPLACFILLSFHREAFTIRKAGSLLLHISFVLILGGALLSMASRPDRSIFLAEGEAGVIGDRVFRLDDFRFEREGDGIGQVFATLDAGGSRGVLSVNNPLELGGGDKAYLSGAGLAPRFVILGPGGGSNAVVKASFEEGIDNVTLPGIGEVEIELAGDFFDPSYILRAGGEEVLLAEGRMGRLGGWRISVPETRRWTRITVSNDRGFHAVTLGLGIGSLGLIILSLGLLLPTPMGAGGERDLPLHPLRAALGMDGPIQRNDPLVREAEISG